ncbi:hypothetical protein B0H14DRAFT_559422 [Mycena olivaceomarginata]|nr:hypothetical protein B0H14DRAFT_559422 [Mycena olivaceomarginata]
MLSLTTALLAVLAKQWLRQYSSFIAGSARERALIRQFRYASFDKWGVQLIIGFLPAILHLSLFLFMAGLAVFLYALNHTMATVVASIAGCLLGTYIMTIVLPILAIGCPYRTPLTPLLYSFVYGPGRDLVGLLRKKRNSLARKRSLFDPPKDKFLRQAERTHVRRHGAIWTHSALSWLASTTSDPSAKTILVEALGTAAAPLNVKPLRPVFRQQWSNISLLPDAPCDELRFGRLVRSTVSQADFSSLRCMFDYLPATPIWVENHATILAVAACGCTSTFHWGSDRPVVLPPADAFDSVVEHHIVFDQLAVPMWMWLAICVQAVMKEESSSEWYPSTFFNVSTTNTYNTVVERAKISAWFQRRLLPDSLRRSVDRAIIAPKTYRNRYVPVSLAMFLAVIQKGRSFDNYFSPIILSPPVIPSRSPQGSSRHSFKDKSADAGYRTAPHSLGLSPPTLVNAHGSLFNLNKLLPAPHSSSPPSTSFVQTQTSISHSGPSHSIRAPVSHSSPLSPRPTSSVRHGNDSAEEAPPEDPVSSYATLRELPSNSSASRFTSGLN